MDSQNYSSGQGASFLIIEDPGINRLLRRLHPGVKLKARVVLPLAAGRYLLRIQGYNLVMSSRLKFERFDEVLVKVQRTRPKLLLKLVRRLSQPESRRGMDLVV